MKTSFSGSRSICAANQVSRAAATSARSCSAACVAFFEADLPAIEEAPQGADPDIHAAGREKRLQLGQGDVRRLSYTCEDVARLRLDAARLPIAAMRTRRQRAVRVQLRDPADGAGHTDLEPRRCLAAGQAFQDGLAEALTKINESRLPIHASLLASTQLESHPSRF